MTLSQAKEAFLLLFFCIIIIASGMDLVADWYHGTDLSHILKEAVIFALALVAVLWLFYERWDQNNKIKHLVNELHEADQHNKKANEYVIEGRQQLGKVIQQQFKDWQLTKSESEVGLLLLKGLSQKEIASLRNTAEKTVRQQSSAIYKKSETSGRHAFSAWFIEDIL